MKADLRMRARTAAASLLACAAIVAGACHDSTAPPAEPTTIEVVVGNGQSALAGTEVSIHPVVQIRDQYGEPVAGQTVNFTVESGGGTMVATSVTTDADGKAAAPSWVLGKTAVYQSMRATSGALTAVVFSQVRSDYDLDVRFFGPAMPQVATDAFNTAARRIRAAVIGDVPNYTPPQPIDLTQCNVSGTPMLSEMIDDLVIYAAVLPIDGFGKILASAGPCLIRGVQGSRTNRQTIIGVMRFDAADLDTMVAQGTLQDVIQHEMLHVVGVGTLWTTYGVLQGGGTIDSRFVGSLGVNACLTLGGQPICPGSVPVENTGGPGTADGHWREATFKTEMMTGFVTHPSPGFTGILNPFSAITIQSIGDLGYQVNAAAADPFVIPGLSVLDTRAQLNVSTAESWEQVVRPVLQVAPAGSVQVIR